MDGPSEKNFGLLIAYVIPGLVAMHGIGAVSPTVAQWFAVPPSAPTISGFLFIFVSSLGVGLVASAVRWAIVDRLFHATGLRSPRWDFSLLSENLDAFHSLVISHYRYYQFYANLAVVIPVWWATRRFPNSFSGLEIAVLLAFELLLLHGAKDAITKYYMRAESLLSAKPRLVVGARVNDRRSHT